jgi:hypothetical protein
MGNLNYSNLREGQKYSHPIIGIVTLCDKPNLCFTDVWGSFYFIKITELLTLKK